ncbi:MAG: hypothetical protein ACYCPS_04185 [Candidatus Saccharimonadales bacterium]
MATAITRNYNDRNLKHIFPSWYTILYGAACGFLIPWTILLSFVLPPHYVSAHWDAAWVGFDGFETLLFAITAILAIKHSVWTAFTSIMLGTTLLIDAWFDLMTARTHKDIISAFIEAFALEIPLAIISFALARRIFEFAKHAND